MTNTDVVINVGANEVEAAAVQSRQITEVQLLITTQGIDQFAFVYQNTIVSAKSALQTLCNSMTVNTNYYIGAKAQTIADLSAETDYNTLINNEYVPLFILRRSVGDIGMEIILVRMCASVKQSTFFLVEKLEQEKANADDVYNKSETNELLDNKQATLTTPIDSGIIINPDNSVQVDGTVARTSQLESMQATIDSKANTSDVNSALIAKQNKLIPTEDGGIKIEEDGATYIDLTQGALADAINSKLPRSDVENELSDISENPVQNKVVYSALQDKANSDDVYNKAETNQAFTNAITNTVSGKVVSLDDVSPIEHTIDISGTANDIVNCNSANLLPYPYNNTSAQNGTLIVTDNGDGTLTLNGTTTGRCYFSFAGALNPLTLISGATYTPTIIELGGSKSAGAFYFQIYADSTYHFRTFTLTDPTNIRARLDIDQNSVGMTFNNYKIGCMLVKGNTAPTTYEGYVSFAPVTLDENGQGSITSIAPNMTFCSNNSLSVTYNQDLIKVINTLKNAIITLGGTI